MVNDYSGFAERTVADIADAFPQAVAVFEDAGIDYSCKGLRSIADAAAAAGYEVDDLRALVEAAPQVAKPAQWSQQSLDDLTSFLVADHEDFTTNVVPGVAKSIATMIDRHPSITGFRRIAALFSSLSTAIFTHIDHEERDLFAPLGAGDSVNRGAAKTRLSQRVLREFVEHESFNEQLRTMQEICSRLPADLAGELLAELDRFTRTVHFHMHLENNILYPRAIEMENELQRAS